MEKRVLEKAGMQLANARKRDEGAGKKKRKTTTSIERAREEKKELQKFINTFSTTAIMRRALLNLEKLLLNINKKNKLLNEVNQSDRPFSYTLLK